MNLTRLSLESHKCAYLQSEHLELGTVYSDVVVAYGCGHNRGNGSADIHANNPGASLASAAAHHANYHDTPHHFESFAFAILVF